MYLRYNIHIYIGTSPALMHFKCVSVLDVDVHTNQSKIHDSFGLEDIKVFFLQTPTHVAVLFLFLPWVFVPSFTSDLEGFKDVPQIRDTSESVSLFNICVYICRNIPYIQYMDSSIKQNTYTLCISICIYTYIHTIYIYIYIYGI